MSASGSCDSQKGSSALVWNTVNVVATHLLVETIFSSELSWPFCDVVARQAKGNERITEWKVGFVVLELQVVAKSVLPKRSA